jgi:hypothetical protein
MFMYFKENPGKHLNLLAIPDRVKFASEDVAPAERVTGDERTRDTPGGSNGEAGGP